MNGVLPISLVCKPALKLTPTPKPKPKPKLSHFTMRVTKSEKSSPLLKDLQASAAAAVSSVPSVPSFTLDPDDPANLPVSALRRKFEEHMKVAAASEGTNEQEGKKKRRGKAADTLKAKRAVFERKEDPAMAPLSQPSKTSLH